MVAFQKNLCSSAFLGNPGLEAAFDSLRAIEDLPVERATKALAFLLTGIQQSTWQEIAWCSSPLTSSGYPVEFAFASHGHEIRYTTEIAAPEIPAMQRLSIAKSLMRTLGSECDAFLPAWLAEGHPSATLKYGAWISGRHTLTSDRYKLYIEAPPIEISKIRRTIEQYFGQDYLLSERKAELRMVGIEPSTARTEFYFRIHHLELHQLYPLLALAGCRDAAAILVDFIQKERRWHDPHKLPGKNTGVSYTFAPNSPTPVCTIFLPAGRLWGSDVAIRERLARLSAEQGWQLADYLALSEKLDLTAQGRHRHGLVGLSVLPNGVLAMGVGLSLA